VGQGDEGKRSYKKIPPWFADPHVGKFATTARWSQADIDLLARWADTGAIAGNPKDAPAHCNLSQAGTSAKPDSGGRMQTSSMSHRVELSTTPILLCR